MAVTSDPRQRSQTVARAVSKTSGLIPTDLIQSPESRVYKNIGSHIDGFLKQSQAVEAAEAAKAAKVSLASRTAQMQAGFAADPASAKAYAMSGSANRIGQTKNMDAGFLLASQQSAGAVAGTEAAKEWLVSKGKFSSKPNEDQLLFLQSASKDMQPDAKAAFIMAFKAETDSEVAKDVSVRREEAIAANVLKATNAAGVLLRGDVNEENLTSAMSNLMSAFSGQYGTGPEAASKAYDAMDSEMLQAIAAGLPSGNRLAQTSIGGYGSLAEREPDKVAAAQQKYLAQHGNVKTVAAQKAIDSLRIMSAEANTVAGHKAVLMQAHAALSEHGSSKALTGVVVSSTRAKSALEKSNRDKATSAATKAAKASAKALEKVKVAQAKLVLNLNVKTVTDAATLDAMSIGGAAWRDMGALLSLSPEEMDAMRLHKLATSGYGAKHRKATANAVLTGDEGSYPYVIEATELAVKYPGDAHSGKFWDASIHSLMTAVMGKRAAGMSAADIKPFMDDWLEKMPGGKIPSASELQLGPDDMVDAEAAVRELIRDKAGDGADWKAGALLGRGKDMREAYRAGFTMYGSEELAVEHAAEVMGSSVSPRFTVHADGSVSQSMGERPHGAQAPTLEDAERLKAGLGSSEMTKGMSLSLKSDSNSVNKGYAVLADTDGAGGNASVPLAWGPGAAIPISDADVKFKEALGEGVIEYHTSDGVGMYTMPPAPAEGEPNEKLLGGGLFLAYINNQWHLRMDGTEVSLSKKQEAETEAKVESEKLNGKFSSTVNFEAVMEYAKANGYSTAAINAVNPEVFNGTVVQAIDGLRTAGSILGERTKDVLKAERSAADVVRSVSSLSQTPVARRIRSNLQDVHGDMVVGYNQHLNNPATSDIMVSVGLDYDDVVSGKVRVSKQQATRMAELSAQASVAELKNQMGRSHWDNLDDAQRKSLTVLHSTGSFDEKGNSRIVTSTMIKALQDGDVEKFRDTLKPNSSVVRLAKSILKGTHEWINGTSGGHKPTVMDNPGMAAVVAEVLVAFDMDVDTWLRKHDAAMSKAADDYKAKTTP